MKQFALRELPLIPTQRDVFHMPDGPEQQARDQVFEEYFGSEPGEGFPSRW